MDRARTRITVAGAGAFGLTIAGSLARAGFTVSVFDPSETNASSVAAGMLAPVFETLLDPVAAGHFPLLLAARDLWPKLAREVGVKLDLGGAMAVGDGDFLGAVAAGFAKLGLTAQELARSDLEAAATGLAPALMEGLLTLEDWRLDAAAALAALRKSATEAGVVFRRQSAAGLEGADRLVIATGAAQGLTSVAPLLKVLTPIKGQILRAGASGFDGVLRLPNGYCVGGSGGFAVGATMEPGVDDLAPTEDARMRLEAVARDAFPDLETNFETQVGVRAATPDGLPMIGCTADPNVFLAVGARRNGWLLAPMAAQIITACLTEGEAGPYAARLDPMRFV
ncbi:MAG: D-amino-acid oxidase [Alphaproteobacteria bacterium PA2]|nr:MAG: D-amino-acid oxidase [Alphaproteobacteria bacterium PA2]